MSAVTRGAATRILLVLCLCSCSSLGRAGILAEEDVLLQTAATPGVVLAKAPPTAASAQHNAATGTQFAEASSAAVVAPPPTAVVAPMMLQLKRRAQPLQQGTVFLSEDESRSSARNSEAASPPASSSSAADPLPLADRAVNQSTSLAEDVTVPGNGQVSQQGDQPARSLRGAALGKAAVVAALAGGATDPSVARMPYVLSQISSYTTSHFHRHDKPAYSHLFGNMRGHLVLQFALCVLAIAGLMLSIFELLRSREGSAGPYEEVAKLPVTSAAELRHVFNMHGTQRLFPTSETKIQRTGKVVRLRGRVVARGPSFTAPFSARPATFYSASVSRSAETNRLNKNNVHRPPLAYHSAGMDFAIQLTPSEEGEVEEGLVVNVAYQNVSLFGMEEGEYRCHDSFQTCPADWQGFVLAHLLVPGACNGASTTFARCADLGQCGDALDFRECALTLGAEVTCVGEVVREHDGSLKLLPWRLDEQPSKDAGIIAAVKARPRSNKPLSIVPKGLSESVLVSDDRALFEGATTAWAAPGHLFAVFGGKGDEDKQVRL